MSRFLGFLNFIAGVDTDPRAIAKEEERQARQDEETRRQTEEDGARFLADQKAGKTHPSMMNISDTLGKWMVGGMALLALSGMFNSCASQAHAEDPVAATAMQQQVQKRNLQVPTHDVMVKI
jgi:hypothetical protein